MSEEDVIAETEEPNNETMLVVKRMFYEAQKSQQNRGKN
jgi:hypothetical protein